MLNASYYERLLHVNTQVDMNPLNYAIVTGCKTNFTEYVYSVSM